MSTLHFISLIKNVPCCQRALIGINTMTSGSQQSSSVTDPFVSPFSMKEFHGKGCVVKPRKQRRAMNTKKSKHFADKSQMFISKSRGSAAVTPVGKASPVLSRRGHNKGKRSKSTRSFKSLSQDDADGTTSSISPTFRMTSYRVMMPNEVKRAWEERSSRESYRTPLSFEGKNPCCSIISMDFKTGTRMEPVAKSHRRYLHSRPTRIEDVGKELGRGRYKNVIVMSGAGISTPSGIPDFRLVSFRIVCIRCVYVCMSVCMCVCRLM